MVRAIDDYKWIWGYLKKYRLMTSITIVGSVIEIMLFTMPWIFVSKLIDLFLNNAPPSETQKWLFLMLGVAILQGIVFYCISTVNEILAHRVTTDMTYDLFDVLQSRPMHYHDRQRIGDIMARATGDTRIINIGLSPALRVLGQQSTAFIFSFAVLFSISPQLGLVIGIAFPFFLVSVVIYGRQLNSVSEEIQQLFSELSVVTSETFKNIREIKSYVLNDRLETSFANLSLKQAKKTEKLGIIAAYYYPGLLLHLVSSGSIIYGVYLIVTDNITIPTLVLFIGLVGNLRWMSGNLQFIAEYAAKTSVSTYRVRSIIQEQVKDVESGDIEFDNSHADIDFRDVSFSYDGVTKVLENVNVDIKRGETVAIVGGPGSGKSTFIKLLLRLYDVTEGEIRLGGKPIGSFSNQSLRRNITAIEQNIFLFSNTVRWNIAFGSPEATEEEIQRSIKLASADQFIEELPNKIETEIGERGVKLSGGQKQRIAIARALLLNPAILIMDDASSALDSETEHRIQVAIKNVLKSRTSLIITHRLSLISLADRVLVFKKGRIVANGPHSQLIKTSPEYREIYEEHYELPPLEVKM